MGDMLGGILITLLLVIGTRLFLMGLGVDDIGISGSIGLGILAGAFGYPLWKMGMSDG